MEDEIISEMCIATCISIREIFKFYFDQANFGT